MSGFTDDGNETLEKAVTEAAQRMIETTRKHWGVK
jgi:hypothetical protein